MSDALKQYSYFLKIILARKRCFLFLAMGIMTVGVVLAFVLPKKYEAETTVFVDQNVITDLVKGIAVTPSVDSKIKKLSVSLLSRTMLTKVLSALDKDLVQNDKELAAYIEDLTKRIRINYKERERVFKISLRDSNPVFARDFINTLTRKYIDENTSSKREESLEATVFLADQIETFKKRIDAADEAINKYKSEKGLILATDDIYLRGEIASAEKKLEELSIRRSALEAKKQLLEGHAPDTGQLAAAQARLASLRARYTDLHPKVIAARAEVARLRSGQGSRPRHTVVAAPNGESPQMLQVEIDALREMENHQSKIIDDSKALLREIPSVRATLADLVRKKENEALIYQQLVSRYGQSEVSKQMELQDKSITFRILDPAILPLVPVSPNRPLFIVASIVAGFCLSFAIIWLLDVIKGGVNSPNDLKQLHIPVFAVIPHVPDCVQDHKRQRQDRLLIGLTVGYVMILLVVASADVLHLQDAALQMKTSIHDMLATIVGRH